MPRRTLYPEGKNQDIITQSDATLAVLQHRNGSIIIGKAITTVVCTRPNTTIYLESRQFPTDKDLFSKGNYVLWRNLYKFPLQLIRKAEKITQAL